MPESGLHTIGEERPLKQRFFWLWIALAFAIGLLPGVAGLLWYRSASTAYTARLNEKRNELVAENTKLQADNTKLKSQVTALTVSSASSAPASTGPVPAPAPGTIAFVSRAVNPDTVASGGAILLTTVIAGKADNVYMQVKSANGSVSKIYKLIKGATSGNAITWTRKDALAPKTAGVYTVFSWADANGKQFMMDGAGTLTVK